MEDKPTYAKDFKAIAKEISDAIEIEANEPGEIQEKIKLLASLTGSAAALQANAKKELLRKELELLDKYKGKDMQASVLMRTITAETFEEAGWLCYAERLNAGISHALDGLRSVLSYIKMDFEQSNNQ